MSIGLGVFLMALGLILALGVRDRLSDFDLSMIGWVLTGVGALAIVVSVMITSMRTRGRTRSTTEYVERPRREYVERRDDVDPL
jgi:TRAP-type C4-dicarboxylate transport system permease large subunit